MRRLLKVGQNRYGQQGRCIAQSHHKAQTQFEIVDDGGYDSRECVLRARQRCGHHGWTDLNLGDAQRQVALYQRRADSPAAFEQIGDLPSGASSQRTVGPIIDGRVVMHVGFTRIPPSDVDVALTKEAMNRIMGGPPETLTVSNTPRAAQPAMRKFMGGGMG